MDLESTGITRRQALLAIGALGTVGLVAGAIEVIGSSDSESVHKGEPGLERAATDFVAPRSGDFALQGRANDKSVVVLGAGVAGLCCAYELGKAGYRVTIVEARNRIGGRCVTLRNGDVLVDTTGVEQRCEFSDGRWFNPGPARIAQHHTTMAYCRELGVPIEVFVNTNIDAFVATDGTEVRRRRAVQADLDGYVSELLAKSIARDALDDELSSTERALLSRYLRDVAELGRSDRGFDTVPGVDDQTGAVGDPTHLGTLLRLGIGERLKFERDFDQASPMFHPTGGMDAIPRALLAATTADLRLGHRVIEGRSTAQGVEVVAIDETGLSVTVAADYGICTLPPHLAARLTTNWGTPLVRALKEPLAVTTGKIGLEYNDRFWERQGILGGISLADPAIRTIWYPSTDYLGNGGVVVGAYPFGPAADHFGRLSHDNRLDLALRHGTAIHGEVYRETLNSSISVDWSTQPYSETAWNQWRRFGSGYSNILAGDGRWSFAGDWLSRTAGWQHGAFESARHTVTHLHQHALNSD